VVEETPSGHPRWKTVHDRPPRLLTPFYEVFLDGRSGFRLITDRATSAPLLVPPKSSGTLAGIVAGRDCVSRATSQRVTVEPGRAVVNEEGRIGGIPYRSRWTFWAHTRRIDWHGEIDFAGELVGRAKGETPEGPPADFPLQKMQDEAVAAYDDHEHKIRLRFFPYLSPYAKGIRDLPFHVSETGDAYLNGLYWTAVSDGGTGVALFNRGCMGSVREKDGALSSILAFSLPYVWHTRILKGTYEYDLGILPFRGDWREADLHRQAVEYNFPVVAARVDSRRSAAAPLGRSWSPCEIRSGAGAMLSALYTKGDGLYARFCETRGGRTDVSMDWMGESVRFTETDMRERERAGHGDTALLGPWQVRTYRLARLS
jgi:hypothetical protein